MLDFCLSSVGIESACLADIAYGRLKIEDTETGVSQIIALDMVDGLQINQTENYNEILHDYMNVASYLSTKEVQILDQMIVDSRVDIYDPMPEPIDTFRIELTDEGT